MKDWMITAAALTAATVATLLGALFVAMVTIVVTSPLWAIGLIALKYVGWI